MAKKTEEAPIARRSSYIDVNTGQQTPQPTPTTELPLSQAEPPET